MANKRFKVGTFNLYNLVLPDTPFYQGRRYSQEQYQRKVRWAAEQLRRMDCTIVGFQEIFHAQALQDVLDESGIYEGATTLLGETDGKKPAIGLVSRFPVLEHDLIPGFPPQARLEINDMSVPCGCFSRPLLYAKVKAYDDLEIMVIVVHLKSKNPIIREGADGHDPMERAIGKAKSLIVRTAEATALRCVLLDKLGGNDNPVIVLGDTNDIGTAVERERPWARSSAESFWAVGSCFYCCAGRSLAFPPPSYTIGNTWSSSRSKSRTPAHFWKATAAASSGHSETDGFHVTPDHSRGVPVSHTPAWRTLGLLRKDRPPWLAAIASRASSAALTVKARFALTRPVRMVAAAFLGMAYGPMVVTAMGVIAALVAGFVKGRPGASELGTQLQIGAFVVAPIMGLTLGRIALGVGGIVSTACVAVEGGVGAGLEWALVAALGAALGIALGSAHPTMVALALVFGGSIGGSVGFLTWLTCTARQRRPLSLKIAIAYAIALALIAAYVLVTVDQMISMPGA